MGGKRTRRKNARRRAKKNGFFRRNPKISKLMICSGIVAAIVVMVWLSAKKPEPVVPPKKSRVEKVVQSPKVPEKKQKKITLEEVRTGKADPKQYLKQLEEELVKDRSGFVGFIYEPTEEEIEQLLRNSLARVLGKTKLEGVLEIEMVSVRKMMNEDSTGAFVPLSYLRVSQKVKRYVVVKKELFEHEHMKNEDYVKGTLKHELVHIKDFYKGIQINGVDLFEAVRKGKINLEFVGGVMEARAYYSELKNIVESEKQPDVTQVKGYLNAVVFAYATNLQLAHITATNDLEKQILRKFLEAYTKAMPKVIINLDGSISINIRYLKPDESGFMISSTYSKEYKMANMGDIFDASKEVKVHYISQD